MLNGRTSVINVVPDNRLRPGPRLPRQIPSFRNGFRTAFHAVIILQGLLVTAGALDYIRSPAILLAVVLSLFFTLGIQVMRIAGLSGSADRQGNQDEEQETDRDLLQIAAECMPLGLVMYDASKRLIVANEMYRRMYDVPPEFIEQGVHLRTILEDRYSEKFADVTERDAAINDVISRIEQRIAHTRVDTLDDGRKISIAHKPLPAGGWVSTHEDVTENYMLQEKMRYLAHHDSLTGLKNRAYFWEHLRSEIVGLEWSRGEIAVHLIDLDHFKKINDLYGHDVGDFVLKEIAVRLLSLVRQNDIVARLGGDEFAIIQSGSMLTRTSASALAARTIESVTSKIGYRDKILSVGASVGIALASEFSGDEKKLVKCADIALYGAKSDGKSCFRFFDPVVHTEKRGSLIA